jgi:hypothetical protein
MRVSLSAEHSGYRWTREAATMGDPFDPYREALVMETVTVWPEEYAQRDPAERGRIEARLHAEPQHATELEYVRLHTGFCRRITVPAEDLERLN